MADSADPDQPAVGWRTDAAIAPRRQDAALYASDAPCTVPSSSVHSARDRQRRAGTQGPQPQYSDRRRPCRRLRWSPDHAEQCRHAQFLQRLCAGRGADRKSQSQWIEDLLPQTGPEAQQDHGGVRQMGEC
jgi:hypothetical protein